MMHGSSKKGIKASVEAGCILSECVVNTKTIFKFNFQHGGIQMYLDVIEYIKNPIIGNTLNNGFFIGLGNFCSFAANCAVYEVAKNFILDGSMDSEDIQLY